MVYFNDEYQAKDGKHPQSPPTSQDKEKHWNKEEPERNVACPVHRMGN